MMIANYTSHRTAFQTLLQENTRRILLVTGAKESGKTALLGACLAGLNPEISCATVDLRNTAGGVVGLIGAIAQRLGWKKLPALKDRWEAIGGPIKVEVSRNTMIGFSQVINVQLGTPGPATKDDRALSLTDALLDGTDRINGQVLLVFDSFETASLDIQQWIAGQLLPFAAQSDAIRVVIAGRMTPDPNDLTWGQMSELCELQGVSLAADWLPIFKASNRMLPPDVPSGDPATWLAGVCYALKGQPGEIMRFINTLPKAPAAS